MSNLHSLVSPASWIDALGALETIESGFAQLEEQIGKERRESILARANPQLSLTRFVLRPRLRTHQNQVIRSIREYAKAVDSQARFANSAIVSGLSIAYEGARLSMGKTHQRQFGEALVELCDFSAQDPFGPTIDDFDIYCNPLILGGINAEPYRDYHIRGKERITKFRYAFYAGVSVAFEQLVSEDTLRETSQLPVIQGGIDFVSGQAEIAMLNESLSYE